MNKRDEQTNTYRRWWKGKKIRVAGSNDEYQLVVDCEFIGPPSAVYGIVHFKFEDGERSYSAPGNAFKPRKKDFEILEN